MCLSAEQVGSVLNGLNARKSEIFTEFPQRGYFKLLKNIRHLFGQIIPKITCFGRRIFQSLRYRKIPKVFETCKAFLTNDFMVCTNSKNSLTKKTILLFGVACSLGLHKVFNGNSVNISDCKARSQKIN